MARKIAPVYLVIDYETVLHCPPARAWPHVINYPAWQNYSIVQHVSGPCGGEGEVVLLKKEEGGTLPPYHARTIKLEPGRRIIWKTYPAVETAEHDFFGIVEFTLCDRGGNTSLRSHAVYEFNLPHDDERELKAFRERHYAAAGAMNEVIFSRLKAIVARCA